jgi:hypothetical protein
VQAAWGSGHKHTCATLAARYQQRTAAAGGRASRGSSARRGSTPAEGGNASDDDDDEGPRGDDDDREADELFWCMAQLRPAMVLMPAVAPASGTATPLAGPAYGCVAAAVGEVEQREALQAMSAMMMSAMMR